MQAFREILRYPGYLLVVALGVTGVLLFVAALMVYFVYFGVTLSADSSELGAFGDFIGGISNPILSLLVLVAILTSLLYQSRELASTRRELRDSSSALAAQNFLTTFFKLLEFLRTLHIQGSEKLAAEIEKSKQIDGLSSSVISDGKSLLVGNLIPSSEDTFEQHVKKLSLQIEQRVGPNQNWETDPSTFNTNAELVEEVVNQWLEKSPIEVEIYLANLLIIMKLIDENKNTGDTALFINLLKAQIGFWQQALVFYYALALSSQGEDELKQLLEEHSFFADLNVERIACSNSLRSNYEDSAFG